jgi:hypothetical protein
MTDCAFSRPSRRPLAGTALALLLAAALGAPAAHAQKGAAPVQGQEEPATPAGEASDSSFDERHEAMLEAWDEMPFRVRNAVLVEEPAQGYGMYAPATSNSYASGETILGYAELLGYSHRRTEEGWSFGVVADLRVRSPEGEVLFEQSDLIRQEMQSRHRNTEFFLNLTYTLNSPPGPYVIETVVRDINSDRQARFEQEVRIVEGSGAGAAEPRPVAPSPPAAAGPAPGPSAGAAQPDLMADPLFGTVDLDTGFMPDPVAVQVNAGGPNNASHLGAGCAGFINAVQPDVRLNFRAGSYPMNIYVTSQADTTLAVNLPNGQWICNDDSEGFDPWVQVQPALSGQYDIWVGTYQPGATPPATLFISELAPRW